MLKRAAISLIAVALIGYAISAILEAKEKERIREREYKAEQDAFEEQLKMFVVSHGADGDWQERLFKDKDMMSEVMTIEVEPFWLGDRPVLFNGKLIDVKSHDDKYYIVKLRQTIMQKIEHSLMVHFGMDVLAEKSMVDKLLHDNPDIMDAFNVFTTLHAIVKIDSIKTVVESDGGDTTEVLVGDGVLLGMLYSGR